MKSLFALFLVLGLVFQPAFLSAAEEAAADSAVLAEEGAKDDELEEGLDDWELGADDLAADEDDLTLDEEEEATEEGAAPAADANAKAAQ